MASLRTIATRLRLPHTATTCTYCGAHVEFLAPERPTDLKIECVECQRRFLVAADNNDKVPADTVPLTVFLPAETLSSILAYLSLDCPSLLSAALVSHFWNDCATPVLYRTIILKWDSRRGPPLIRTFEAKPHLLPVVRSVDIEYPRIDEWVGEDMLALQQVEYNRLVALNFPGLDGVNLVVAVEPRQFEFEDAARDIVVPRWLEMARSVGAGNWMDGGLGVGVVHVDGEDRRRVGACALLKLLSQCPRLWSLSLRGFDFGMGQGLDLEARLPVALPSVKRLSLANVHSSARRLILARTLNLQDLRLPYLSALPSLYFGGSHPVLLPHLHSLSLGGIRRAPQFANIVELLDMGGPSLRTLELTTHTQAAATAVASLLSHAPNLHSLVLVRASEPFLDGILSDPPPPALLDHLSASMTLTTLRLMYVASKDLVAALPATLTTFVALAPPPPPTEQQQPGPTPTLVDAIRSITAAKRTKVVALETCTLVGVAGEAEEETAAAALVKDAEKVGLEILLMRRDLIL